MRRIVTVLAGVTAAALLGSCAQWSMFGEDLARALKGQRATMSTYTQDGQLVDRVQGTSIRVSRDEKFDSSDAEGNSNKDSSVLLVSVGDSHVSHVGSSMVIAQEGLTDIRSELPRDTVDIRSRTWGAPWLNDVIEKHRNLWRGKGKTIMVRSQDGTPIAVFAGDTVENFATDVPKSTAFRVDGKYLFVYRCDYTVYDNDLL